MKENEKNNKCISFGKIDKKYWLSILLIIILIAITLGLLYSFVAYLENSENNDLKMRDKVNGIIFLFFEKLGESLMIIPGLISKKINSSHQNNSLTKQRMNNIDKYIFNPNIIKFSRKEKIYLILLIVLGFFADAGSIYSQLFFFNEKENLEFFESFIFCDLLFLFFFSKFIFKITFYKHQYISIIILLLIDIMNLILKNIREKEGVFGIFMFFFVYIILSFFKSLKIVLIKGYMEFKYISPYKMTFIFGIIHFFIIILIYIIVSFIPCSEKFCKTIYNEKYYFAHIFEIFSITGIFLFFIFLMRAFLITLNYVIILYFSVCHSFLYFQFSEAGNLLLNIENINYSYFYYFKYITFPAYAIGSIIILIFLEIIEIHLCGISYNTKNNIRGRSESDIEFIEDIHVDEESSVDEERKEEIIPLENIE